eukprot:1079656-Amphidinium_carterae.1
MEVPRSAHFRRYVVQGVTVIRSSWIWRCKLRAQADVAMPCNPPHSTNASMSEFVSSLRMVIADQGVERFLPLVEPTDLIDLCGHCRDTPAEELESLLIGAGNALDGQAAGVPAAVVAEGLYDEAAGLGSMAVPEDQHLQDAAVFEACQLAV